VLLTVYLRIKILDYKLFEKKGVFASFSGYTNKFIFSISLPIANKSSSFHLFAIRWSQTGMFSHLSSIVQTGIEIAGNHAKFAGTVYISAKYIFNGSFIFSHIFQATSGVVGLKIKSYFWNTLSKSCIIFSLTFSAFK
jgi:hypothetical protein